MAVLSETIRVTKKDIQAAKAPDAVLEGATSVFDWLVERRNIVLAALAALLVAVVAMSMVSASRAEKQQEIGGKLSSAVALANRPVTEGTPTGETSFATAAEKRKAVEEAFGAIVRDHPGTEAARTATLKLAVYQLQDGRAAEAIAGLEQYLQGGASADLKLFAVENLGYAYEAKGDLAKAAETFQQLAEAGAPARAVFHQGRIAELKGDKAEARKQYERVVAEFGAEPVAGDARVRLELLALAPPDQPGFTAPTPAPPPKGKGKRKAKVN